MPPQENLRSLWFGLLLVAAGLYAPAARADVESGPRVGEPAPALNVAAITGEFADQQLDYAERRGEAPTIYVFVPDEKWSRPTARLLRKLDEAAPGAVSEARIVAVWLTADVAKTRDYLPRAQESLKFEHTALTVYEQDVAGPGDWGVNSDADVTIVVTRGGKIAAAFGFVSPNETLSEQVIAALQAEARK
jgi:hypothetical protein